MVLGKHSIGRRTYSMLQSCFAFVSKWWSLQNRCFSYVYSYTRTNDWKILFPLYLFLHSESRLEYIVSLMFILTVGVTTGSYCFPLVYS